MAVKRFSNQDLDQVIAHMRSFLQEDLSYDIRIDPLAGHCEINTSRGGKKGSNKKSKLKELSRSMRPRKRKLVSAAKRREKPKLKHVRNGREIKLTGYAPRTNY